MKKSSTQIPASASTSATTSPPSGKQGQELNGNINNNNGYHHRRRRGVIPQNNGSWRKNRCRWQHRCWFLLLEWWIGLISMISGVQVFHLLHTSFENDNNIITSEYDLKLAFDCNHQHHHSVRSPSLKKAPISNNQTLQQQQQQQQQQPQDKSYTPKFAYAFLIAGCDPKTPLAYRPYIWNILVAALNLQDDADARATSTSASSTIDIVVMVQFQRNDDNRTATTTRLPANDLQWLQLFGGADDINATTTTTTSAAAASELFPNVRIHIHYIPNDQLRDNFYNAQLLKFHILTLTQYDRVLYMDADVMPLCSMEYLMQRSMMTNMVNKKEDNHEDQHHHKQRYEELALQPNVILAWFTEPSHGGFFLVEPGGFDEWKAIVERREQEALQLPYPHWNPIIGWGEKLQEEWQGLPQPIETLEDGSTHRYGPPRHSTNWTFHGDFADQGLLYYWTRFHRKQVSIVYLDYVLDYVDGTLVNNRSNVFRLKDEDFSTCLPVGKDRLGEYGSTLQAPLFYDKIPHRDFIHFSGTQKPWETKRNTFPNKDNIHSSTDYWYAQLERIFHMFATKYPTRKLPTLPLKFKSPALGRYPTHRSMIGTIQKKERKRKQQEQQITRR